MFKCFFNKGGASTNIPGCLGLPDRQYATCSAKVGPGRAQHVEFLGWLVILRELRGELRIFRTHFPAIKCGTFKFSSHAAPGPNPSLFGRNEQSWPSTEELTLAPEEQIKVRFLGSWLLAAHRREIWRFWRFVI